MHAYQPGEYTIGFGVPGTDLYLEVKDWVSLTPSKTQQRFTIIKGILGEPFLDVSTDSSRTFTLSLLQRSKDVEDLHNMFLAQLIGIVGVPFSIIDNSTDTSATQGKQKSLYPVGVILDERQETLDLEGGVWTYDIGTPSGTTIFF